ncbi:uncharacterized protein LOC132698550 [Cylas formicarius]|uniref:uncharacterized protein LOC132698550 n=1 Tax=Cylas formicarius TaxID=197179 RepID=UPI00295880F3|nr:uncharacterized protein LOC132698550 [Cylas formicarius]
MLPPRGSIILEVICLILCAGQTRSQSYDYSAEDGEGEYYSEHSDDGHEHPDYSKYFAEGAASSPVAAKGANADYNAGFVNPAEFESFFSSPIAFGESERKEVQAPQITLELLKPQAQKADPFEALRQSFSPHQEATNQNSLKTDYFEAAQKKQQLKADDDEIQPGPHYVSHQLPVPALFNDGQRASSKDDVETIRPPVKKPKVKVDKAKPGFDGFKDAYDAFDVLRKTEDQIDQTKPQTFYNSKNVDYNTGKSSSSVSQYPAASGISANLQGVPTTTLRPYDKYSFQPGSADFKALQSKYLEALASPSTPIKPIFEKKENANDDELVLPSESIAESLKDKNCRKISGPDSASGMNCFVCEDASNNAKYTQCSYSSDEEPVNEYSGSSHRYSAPAVPTESSYRYKRSPRRYYDKDPYTLVRDRSRRLFDEFDKEQQAAETERQKDFTYVPFTEEEAESFASEQQSEALKGADCQKVDREGMTCTVCKNEKTGGNFEQCSYTSAPKEHKYAYVAEKKYDSDDDAPEESKKTIKELKGEAKVQNAEPSVPVAAVEQYQGVTKSKIVKDAVAASTNAGASEEGDEESEAESDDETENDEEKKEKASSDDASYYSFPDYSFLKDKEDKKLVDETNYDVPEHFAASVQKKKTAEEKPEEEDDFDEYHYRIFPEYLKEESKNEEQSAAAPEKKDVEEVLAEFAKKDRSNCKKAEKNGMTCFLCVDQNKVQHEECMYVQESRPKATHVAYHELQRLKDPKTEEPAESKAEPVTQSPEEVAAESKRKKFFKKVSTPLPLLKSEELVAAASDVEEAYVAFAKPDEKRKKDSASEASDQEPERLKEDEIEKSMPKEKEEEVAENEGAFSEETKPVYSELYGTTLPKYMVEKTEFEKDFDAAAGFA